MHKVSFLYQANSEFQLIIVSSALLISASFLYVYIHKSYLDKYSQSFGPGSIFKILIADLFPGPVFHFNYKGNMLFANKSAMNLLTELNLFSPDFHAIFLNLKEIKLNEIISKNESKKFIFPFSNDIFEINIIGFSDMGFAQVNFIKITKQINLESELTNTKIIIHDLSLKIQSLQESERKNISRELHDSLGQSLASLKFHLDNIQAKFINDPETLQSIADSKLLIQSSIGELRNISYNLNPRSLEDFGLVPSLKILSNEFSKQAKIKGNFHSSGVDKDFNHNLEIALYRIVQESLNNILKHSKASEFGIMLIQQEDFLRLIIEDNGSGFDINKIKLNKKKSSMGLINIKERIIPFDGKLTINSRKGAGTSISVDIPLTKLCLK